MGRRLLARTWRCIAASLVAAGILGTGPSSSAAADQRVAAIATTNGRSEKQIRKILADPAAKVDAGNRIFFVDPLVAGSTPPAAATAAYPYASTFRLHSRPGSSRVIYLDFDGQLVYGSAWSGYVGLPFIDAEPFSLDASAAFSDAEQDVIQSVWQRVAEDFAIFDVDVTTEDPGEAAITRSGVEDQQYGTRALITDNQSVADRCGCLGVAYLGAFAESSYHAWFQPAFVLSEKLQNSAKAIADAASHEVGHNLSLIHDGGGGLSYYSGHGSWAPIMGFSIERPITQWSRGEYDGADNSQDDIATIGEAGAPLLDDDHGDTAATATAMEGRVTLSGTVSSDVDVDAFRVQAGAGGATISVDPAPVGPNLDARLELRSASGALVAADDPPSAMVSSETASGLGAVVSLTIPAGDYVILVSGVGTGTPTTGYVGYGSVGRFTLTTGLNQPAIAVTSSQNPAPWGVPVTLTASVTVPTPGPVTGTVTFKDGLTPICTAVPVSGGRAGCTRDLGAGRHTITAAYSGNGTLPPSASAPLEQVVDGDDTAVTVTSSPNPSLADQEVTFRAVVGAQPPMAATPSGKVTFRAGATILCADVAVAAGEANCTRSLAAGRHAVTAEYGGDRRFDTSAAGMDQSVARAGPTVALRSSANPVVYSTPLILTATVASGGAGVVVPTGIVDFLQGSTVLCRAQPLSTGSATCAPRLPTGSHDLTAVYRGDASFTEGTSPVMTQVVTRSPVEVNVAVYPSASAAGETVSFYATVYPYGATSGATVTFRDGSEPICLDIPVSGGSASCSRALGFGTHSISASYSGDPSVSPGTSATLTHVVGLAAARVWLRSSAATTTPGTGVTFTATVSAVVAAMGTPAGSVSFGYGDTTLCRAVPVVLGQALCAASLGAGNHPVTATYSGDAAFSLAVSPAVNVVVNGEPAAVTISSSLDPSVWGQPVTLRAVVTGAPGAAPTGTVTFNAGTVTPCSNVALVSGEATCTGPLPVGAPSVSANYSGDGRFNGAISDSLGQTVRPADSVISFTPPAGPFRAGTTVDLTASVSVVAPGAATTYAPVTFRDGDTYLCDVWVPTSGSASCGATLAQGVRRITASSAGTSQLNGSTTGPREVTVLPEGDELVPVTPTRLLDTRVGIGGPAVPVGPDATREVVVRGGGTGIPERANAVVVNTTVTGGTAPSYLTVHPTGQLRRESSNLNFAAGLTIPNLVMVGVGTGGKISIYNQGGNVHVLVDVVGYYTDAGGATFTPVTPSRLLDTRTGTGGPAVAVGPGATRELVVRGGATGIPDSATAVVLNMTAVSPTAASYLTVSPSGRARPNASNLNFLAGQTIPNLVVVGVGTGGRISIFNAAGAVHVLADVVGYYAPGGGSRFTPMAPTRAFDTRMLGGGFGDPVGPGVSRLVGLRGGVIPANATSVVVNVTVAFATAPSYLTVSPSGLARPLASNLNFGKGQIIPNLVVSGLGPGGGLAIFNAAGSVHVVIDVVGYMS